MYVCICHGIRESHVKDAARQAGPSVSRVCRALGLRPQCAKCVPELRALLRDAAPAAVSTPNRRPATA